MPEEKGLSELEDDVKEATGLMNALGVSYDIYSPRTAFIVGYMLGKGASKEEA